MRTNQGGSNRSGEIIFVQGNMVLLMIPKVTLTICGSFGVMPRHRRSKPPGYPVRGPRKTMELSPLLLFCRPLDLKEPKNNEIHPFPAKLTRIGNHKREYPLEGNHNDLKGLQKTDITLATTSTSLLRSVSPSLLLAPQLGPSFLAARKWAWLKSGNAGSEHGRSWNDPELHHPTTGGFL